MCFLLKRNNLTIGAFHATQVTPDKVEGVGIFLGDKITTDEDYDLTIHYNSGEIQHAHRMTRIQYLGHMHGENRYAVAFAKTRQTGPELTTGRDSQKAMP